jgi:hypothetical protein
VLAKFRGGEEIEISSKAVTTEKIQSLLSLHSRSIVAINTQPEHFLWLAQAILTVYLYKYQEMSNDFHDLLCQPCCRDH